MASQLQLTPAAPCRWFECLGQPRTNRDEPDKAPAWGLRLILDPANPDHMAWLQDMEDKVVEALGKKRKSKWAYPWSHEEEAGEVIIRFKCKQFQRRDGTLSEGPTVVDSRKTPWPQDVEIGNGSVVKVAFRLYQWDGPGTSGSGVTFEPQAIQVIEHVPYERVNAVDAFEEVEGAIAPGSDAVAAF